MSFLKMLDRPPREYTPVPFWFLNGDLSHEEIRRQLRDFCDHGVYGAVLHPRMGLREDIGYLSESFFGYMRTAIETAAELDMRIVLYDEGMYPSGSAGGLVVRDRPDLASRGIARVRELRDGDTLLYEKDGLYLAERRSFGTIRGIHYGEDDGEPGAPFSADILNPEAVERFIRLTHEAYYRHFPEHFGRTVVGFFTDEPSVLGRNVREMFPWTKGFAEQFTAAGGRLSGLTALFDGQENSDTVLYRRLMLEREEQVYYARLSGWCEAHGIALMGHPHQSDDIEPEKYFHVPGQDLVFRFVSPEKGGTAGTDSTMAKCSADMARLLGRRRNSNECFGACNREGNPWYFTGADMKWYIDWLAVRGVNLFIPHAFYYSLEGQRSAERPPDVGPGSIWWPHYRRFAGYMARLSCLMTEGTYHAKIALLCRNRELHAEEAAPLFQQQKSFMYLPESLWAECAEKDRKLIYGNRSFDAVIGPESQFPTVPHGADAVAADCLCRPAQPGLRVASLAWNGRPCWLLVNEGETEIRTRLTLPYQGRLGLYDLWNGTRYRAETENTENGTQFFLSLPYRGSLLVFACGEDEEALPERPRVPEVWPDFHRESVDTSAFRISYSASLSPSGSDIDVCADAEEMAELSVNGQFCGVSFWPPHHFRVPAAYTRDGAAELRLTVTGSPANRYGKPVPYGLKQETACP